MQNPHANLNSEQYMAANAPLGHNLVIASAGTGKTSTIVGRIATLLQRGIQPSEILLLTFTNKASHEMIGRIANIFGTTIANKIEAGTFHSVAYRYLRTHRHILLKQPRELKILFKSIYDRYHFNTEKTPYSYQYLYESYSLYKNSTLTKTYSDWLADKNAEQLEFVEIYEHIFDEFAELKRNYGYADYNDLLIFYREELTLLREKDEMPYIEVLCDEYQDTNPLQDSIIRAIAPKSLFCVGDYDQSIYAFNGADINIITNFTQNYEHAQVFSLSKNYRSSKYILELANRVIANNPRIYAKQLEVVKTNQAHLPSLLQYPDLFQQYNGIAKKIQEIHNTLNLAYSDFAIIYRNNSSADGLEASLKSLGIASKRKGSTNFFEAKEIEFLLCLCNILTNSRDMMSYIHVFSHAKGIGNSIAKDIFEALLILGHGDCKQGLLMPDTTQECYPRKTSNGGIGLFDDFFRKEEAGRFNNFLHNDFKSHPLLQHYKIHKEAVEFLNDFFIAYKENIGTNSPQILLRNLTQTRFYIKYLESLLHERSKTKDGKIDSALYDIKKQQAESRLSILYNLSKNYKDLRSFLNAMVLGSSEFAEGNGVNLLSVHASKGLEFTCVFVVDLMEGRFPNHKLASKAGSIEEERRLFYVALTRAKEYLYLSFALNDSLKNSEYKPSIFLFEGKLLDEKDFQKP
ncbi:ATP-dependent DNA helicase [Helicobacter didelphidarum]|uniref:DNA 3'-5' helicase n=1 Tax=Helicobacter didelphidarum TaxID=2040648 RepID=A0A3D8ICJ2_9HELI|nr:ATP-dependent helicase [Helicobacter didelphidarum]RDU62484.1 ATP-dependent DNA helicase [Helicobacter didelphidarum]